MEHAYDERDSAKATARTARLSLAILAGVQIFLGALTTGLSAIRLSGKEVSISQGPEIDFNDNVPSSELQQRC